MKSFPRICTALVGLLLITACGDRAIEKSSFEEANIYVWKDSVSLKIKNVFAFGGRDAIIYFDERVHDGQITVKADVSLKSGTVVLNGTLHTADTLFWRKSLVTLSSATIFVSSEEEVSEWQRRFTDAVLKHRKLNKKTSNTVQRVDLPRVLCLECDRLD